MSKTKKKKIKFKDRKDFEDESFEVVVGVDPATVTGFAFFTPDSFETHASKDITEDPFSAYADRVGRKLAIVEDQYLSFNPKTFAQLSGIRGVWEYKAREAGFDIYRVYPSEWYSLLGFKGNRDDRKAQTRKYVEKEGLEADITQDEADAFAMAHAVIQQNKIKICFP